MMLEMDIKTYMHQVGQAARTASRVVARADSNAKNCALRAIADAITRDSEILLTANALDINAARAN